MIIIVIYCKYKSDNTISNNTSNSSNTNNDRRVLCGRVDAQQQGSRGKRAPPLFGMRSMVQCCM